MTTTKMMTEAGYECSEAAIEKFPDERNPFTPFARLEFDAKALQPKPTDPRDERIAELEAALRQLRPFVAERDIPLIDRALNPSIELNLSDKETK